MYITTHCKYHILQKQTFTIAKSPSKHPQNPCTETQIFQRKSRYAIFAIWICSTTAYPEKKIIETLKMQWYPGTRFRRKKIYNSISCISLSTFQKITATSITSVQLFIPSSFFMLSPFLELFNMKWNSTDFQSVVF